MDLVSVIGVFVNGLVVFSRWVSDNQLIGPLALVAVIASGLLLMRLWPLFVNYFQQDMAQRRARVLRRSSSQTTSNRGTRRGGFLMERGNNSTSSTVARLDEFIASLPNIQDVRETVATLTLDQRNKLEIPLGQEFQQGLTQMTATELEATAKQREIMLRKILYLQNLSLSLAAYPIVLEAVLKTMAEVQRVAMGFRKSIDMPGYRDLGRALEATLGMSLLGDVQRGQEIPAPEAVSLFLEAGDVLDLPPAPQQAGDGRTDSRSTDDTQRSPGKSSADASADSTNMVHRVMTLFSRESESNGTERANGGG